MTRERRCFVSEDVKIQMHGESVVGDYGDVAAEIRALTAGAGLMDMSSRRRVWVQGVDRVTFLQRMLTQDVTGVNLTSSAPAAMCTAQGRIIGLGLLVGYPDALLFDIPGAMAEALVGALERYTLLDEVELVDCSDEMGHFHLEGPRAVEVLDSVVSGGNALGSGAYQCAHSFIAEVEVALVRHSRAGMPGVDLFFHSAGGEAIRSAVVEAGAHLVGHAAYECVRVESGVPVAGAELTEDVIPVEAGLEHFVSYTKGCYVGQEVIAKIKYLGEPPRTLCGFRRGGIALQPGEELFAGTRRVGRVTSVSPETALGFVRTRNSAAGTRLTLGDAGGAEVVIEALPLESGRGHHQCAMGEAPVE